ncbi:hypothetical protein QJQ45_011716 [Haematococcus lacustris]|nr:hypothetical protein QJQ45_011716 [Haematococcus lacustris]
MTQPAASEPGPSTPPPAKRTRAEATSGCKTEQRFIKFSQLQNSGWKSASRVETDGVSISVHFVPSQAVKEAVELADVGRQLTATSDFNLATHIAVGVDPGVTQAIKAAHAQRDPAMGQVLRRWEWELSKGQLKHDSGRTKAKRDTARWWWMKWMSCQHHDREREVAVFLGAGCFSQGGWKANAVREGFRKVVEQPSRPSTFDRPDRLVIVDEFRTSRVSSSVHAPQHCELHLPRDRLRPADWVPPAGQVIQRLVRLARSQWHWKYVRGLQWCHERIGESMQRPLELCRYEGLEAPPPVGEEYQQHYKLVNDRLPKGRQRLHRAAEYRRGATDVRMVAMKMPHGTATAIATSGASLGVLTWDRRCSSGSSMTLGPEPQPPAAPVQALGTWAYVAQAAVQAVALRQYDPAPRLKQDLEELVSAVEELPFLSGSSQVEQTSQLLWCFADWARQSENSRARMTQAQWNSVLHLLQRTAGVAGEARACKAGKPPAIPPLQQFDARQLSMAAWSLGKLKPHLPAAAVTSACTALASHSASSEAMKRAGWRECSSLLHGLATAGMQCSSSSDLTRLCDQAVQLLPQRMAWGAAGQAISMILLAMAKSGYAGSAQPLLQSVTAAISQGEVMRDAKPQDWANLIWATSKLPGCREEARQLLSLFAIRGMRVVAGCNAQDSSNILYAMSLVLWHDKEVCRQLAERAAQTQQAANGQDLANCLYALARLGYLDSSVRSLAAGVAKADLAAFTAQAVANLLYARSMFLALSIDQAVSSGHSQLASEPQLNSMAAALWRECSRRGQSEELWGKENLTQLLTARQWLHACTGGQISLASSPALKALVGKAFACRETLIGGLQSALKNISNDQLLHSTAAVGHLEVQRAVISQDGTQCAQLLVQGLGLTRGIAVDESSNFLPDGSMSGVVAHAKLQQMTHFDAGVMVNKAVFDQLASDSEQAAFMREQVRASLPEAEAWRQLLRAGGGHCAGQVEAPAAATPAAQQQQAVSVSAGQLARQQGVLPLLAQAKSAGALPSQRAGQAPGLMPRPVRPRGVSHG